MLRDQFVFAIVLDSIYEYCIMLLKLVIDINIKFTQCKIMDLKIQLNIQVWVNIGSKVYKYIYAEHTLLTAI